MARLRVEPTESSLFALSAAMREREHCENTCCVFGDLPGASLPALRGLYERIDPADAEALRKIIDTTRDDRVRALAMFYLAQARDLGDVDQIARFIDSTQTTNRFPLAVIGQAAQPCYPVVWESMTLGRMSLLALGSITKSTFADAAAFRSWQAAHPDPSASFDYWENQFRALLPPPPELFAKLKAKSPELYVRVACMGSGLLEYFDQEELLALMKRSIGKDRILRLLNREQTFPEFADTYRFALFANTVFDRAEDIFEPSDAPALMSLWKSWKLPGHDFAYASLGVAASRFHPVERKRILTDTLAALSYRHDKVLQELAQGAVKEDVPLLKDWFYGWRAVEFRSEGDTAAAILKGLGKVGPPAKPILKALVDAHAPSIENEDAVEALVETAVALGCPDPFPRKKAIRARRLKNMPPAEAAAAAREAEAARRDCIDRVKGWLRKR